MQQCSNKFDNQRIANISRENEIPTKVAEAQKCVAALDVDKDGDSSVAFQTKQSFSLIFPRFVNTAINI